MLTHKSTHPRFWTSLFLFLHLMALLLPASAVTATAQAGGSCAAQSAEAAAPTIVAPASADQVVEIPNQTITAAIFQANWLANYRDAELVRSVLAGNFLSNIDWNNASGNAAYMRWLKRVDEKIVYDNLHDNTHYLDETIHVYLDEALKEPELAVLVPWIWSNLTTYHADLPGYSIGAGDRIAQSAERYDLGERMLALAPEWVAQLHDCAQKNPVFAKVFDAFNLDKLGVSIRDTAKTILEKKPDLPIPASLRQQIIAGGTVAISQTELQQLGQSEVEKLHTTIDDMQQTIKDIDERQKVIVDYLSNQAEKERVREQALKKDAEYKLKLEAAQSGISIITTIAAQIDPKFAKEFNVVATSSLQVAHSLNSWLKATAALGAADKIFSLSSVVMTGNVLGAVMNIVSLFAESGPTPEQQILEEIGKLRQQVQELRVEMHERFDRIDQNLNSIYTTMQQRFDQIDIQLGKINGNIQEVQHSLLELDLKLSRIERNNFEFLNTLGRRPLLEAINGGLGYLERTGQPMPYQPDFVGFENTLHTWATIHAFDPLNAGPTQRDYSDAAVLAELNAYPVDANINYINGWLVAHGLPAIANKRLPSPRDWLFASRAYMQLAMEWPEHMDRIDPKRGEALKQIGLELEAAMRNLSTLGTLTDTVGNQLLISSVITNYQGEINTLDASIQSVENAYMNEVRTARLERNEPFAVHGGAYQTLAYRAAGIRNADCPDATKTCELPGELANRIPGFDLYNLADYLKLGKFSAQLFDVWSNEVRECGAESCYQIADHQVFLIVYFNDVRVLQQKIQLTRDILPANRIWIRDNYTANFKARLARLTEIDPFTPEQEAVIQKTYSETLKKVETQLAAYEQELYGRILNEFNQGSLKAVAAEVEGSKALIDTVVALGLPRAASNDEFLHAMLYGNQQLVDQKPLIQSYMARMATPIEGGTLTNNPRFMLETVAGQRTAVFQSIVNQYLDGISNESYAEEADYLANTRRALELTMQIVAMESGAPQPTPTPTPAPPTGDPQRVYLPVVQR